MKSNIIDGKAIAERIKEEVSNDMELFSKEGIRPKLVSVQAGESFSASVYMKQQKKNCEKFGISFEQIIFDADILESSLISGIEELNSDSSVTGIIVQLPLPRGIDLRNVRAAIAVEKDVEGVNPFNMGWIMYGRAFLASCTALAVKEIVEYVDMNIYGKQAVVVGHSDLVGKPSALFLVDKLATVSMCHIATSEAGNLKEYVEKADLLVVAVGKANVIPGEWIKEGAVVIDVGINRLGDRIVGDVDFESASKRASMITPVPGGVGPVTTAILLRNVIKAAKWMKKK